MHGHNDVCLELLLDAKNKMWMMKIKENTLITSLNLETVYTNFKLKIEKLLVKILETWINSKPLLGCGLVLGAVWLS